MRPLWLFFSYVVNYGYLAHHADIPVMSVRRNYATTISNTLQGGINTLVVYITT